jgi:SWIM zinc finger
LAEQTYHYLAPSAVERADIGLEVALSTSGGAGEHPHFFSGFLGQPRQAAHALLAVAEHARIRAADPVVTSDGDRLRFEGFSVCGGVYARLDLDPGALDGAFVGWGTTNVDFNAPMRSALATVSDAGALLMRVGREEVSVATIGGAAVERKVPLPDRWVKGLAEAQLACAGMTVRHELGPVEARRFLHSLPRSRGGLAWAVPAGRGLRLAARPGPGAVCIASPERVRVLARLLQFASGLRVYGPDPPARGARDPEASAWELVLDNARVTLALSPELRRGFSGEGGILFDLASAQDELVDGVAATLAADRAIDPIGLATALGAPLSDVQAALGVLSAAGRVGYDLAHAAFFHRELPFERSTLEAMHPRLIGARQLVECGDVVLAPDAGAARVMSGGIEYRVRFDEAAARCTCPWFVKHHGTRGPCKHALAAEIVRREHESL